MSSSGNWCLIESDPGVFTELIKGFGCEGVQVEELWSLDPAQFDDLKPIHGLIFLFKWKTSENPEGNLVQDQRLEKIFFAKQVINNACATQAIVSILLNAQHPDVTLGPTLSEFKAFTQMFDPNMRGLALSNSDQIRNVHNGFARQQVFELDPEQARKEDDDVFHFISYVPIDGRLYELDGLQSAPIDLGKIPDDTPWYTFARPAVERRMARYSGSEIHFNLMAVVSDRLVDLTRRLDDVRQKQADGCMEYAAAELELARLGDLIRVEEEKRRRYKIENIRRRHNYVPFIMELIKILGKEGRLVQLASEAKQMGVERAKKRKTSETGGTATS